MDDVFDVLEVFGWGDGGGDIPIPGWFEDMLQKDGHSESMCEQLRRLYRASQARIADGMKQTGATTVQELIERENTRQRLRILRRTGIPETHLQALEQGGLDMTASMRYAREYLDHRFEDGACLVLCGPTGVGKTTAVAWLASQLVLDGRAIVWRYAPEMFAEMRLGETRYSPIVTAGTLIIDDLGAEEDRQAKAKMDAIVYFREGNRRPTVITSNLDSQQFVDKYSRRVVDRIVQWGKMVAAPGESRRRPF